MRDSGPSWGCHPVRRRARGGRRGLPLDPLHRSESLASLSNIARKTVQKAADPFVLDALDQNFGAHLSADDARLLLETIERVLQVGTPA